MQEKKSRQKNSPMIQGGKIGEDFQFYSILPTDCNNYCGTSLIVDIRDTAQSALIKEGTIFVGKSKNNMTHIMHTWQELHVYIHCICTSNVSLYIASWDVLYLSISFQWIQWIPLGYTYAHGLPEQALEWFHPGLGLVVEINLLNFHVYIYTVIPKAYKIL